MGKVLITSDELRKLYTDQKLSTEDIGEMLNCSSSYVSRLLKRNNIPRRSVSEARKLKIGRIGKAIKLKTRVFELCNDYPTLRNLARGMGISVGQIYRVRQGKRLINEKFIIGAIEAFPEYKLDDLFYVAPEGSQNDRE